MPDPAPFNPLSSPFEQGLPPTPANHLAIIAVNLGCHARRDRSSDAEIVKQVLPFVRLPWPINTGDTQAHGRKTVINHRSNGTLGIQLYLPVK